MKNLSSFQKKRKGKGMIKQRNPVVQETIKNPNRSREKYNKNLNLRTDYGYGNTNI